MKRILAAFFALALLPVFAVAPAGAQDGITLVLLHNNDGESQLVDAGGDASDFGGIARFKTLVDTLRSNAEADGAQVLMLSSGDNFLAGPEFDASLTNGVPFYDGIGVAAIGYDAMAIGNHEFDFGPTVFAQFIESTGGAFPFVSANIDVSAVPELQAAVDAGNIAPFVVVDKGGTQIGIVGATTPNLPFISSPGDVVVDGDVAGAVQAAVDQMTADGVNHIVMISHLQGVEDDIELAGELTGVDVMIAGGGDELLAGPDTPLVPGDEEPFGDYPLSATLADGTPLPVVTTPGDYKYVGRLVVDFDADGNVVGVGDDSDLVRVAGGAEADAVEPDADLLANVVDPVVAHTSGLATTVIGTSEIDLDGRREPGVRTQETNIGSLLADSMLWAGQQGADLVGAEAPVVAITNGGGIRNNNVIPAGDFTVLNTFEIAPFSNFVTIVDGVSAEQVKILLENAVSQIPDAGGRFAQVAGLTFSYDPAGEPLTFSDDGAVDNPGARVIDVTLADGTALVSGGSATDAGPIAVATVNFLAAGGDQYDFGSGNVSILPITYQQALADYVEMFLSGVISAADYPGDSGRITAVGDAPAEEEPPAEEPPAEEPPAEEPPLADTGSETPVTVLVAVTILLGGVLLVMTGRRLTRLF